MEPRDTYEPTTESTTPGFFRRATLAATLIVLGLTPWALAQQDPPDYPAYCPPLTAFATPTLFDVIFGTTPIRYPFQ